MFCAGGGGGGLSILSLHTSGEIFFLPPKLPTTAKIPKIASHQPAFGFIITPTMQCHRNEGPPVQIPDPNTHPSGHHSSPGRSLFEGWHRRRPEKCWQGQTLVRCMCGAVCQASKGQLWTRHCAPAAPAFTPPSSPSRSIACSVGRNSF